MDWPGEVGRYALRRHYGASAEEGQKESLVLVNMFLSSHLDAMDLLQRLRTYQPVTWDGCHDELACWAGARHDFEEVGYSSRTGKRAILVTTISLGYSQIT